jgi:CMP-N-acetylneuraminic acid synthetase|tara:strand:- start:16570 stop:17004 length:435 start_codon:yes stop_codon:yes gene_type:complete
MATDSSKSEEALIHFAKNNIFDIIVFIQPTSPLLTSIDIDGGLNLISKYNSVFSAYKEHWFPRWRNKKDPQPIGWEINMRPMRQEKEYNFVENGAFYITTRDCLLSSGLRYSGNIGIYEMPFSRSIQLDNNDDMKVIKALLENR